MSRDTSLTPSRRQSYLIAILSALVLIAGLQMLTGFWVIHQLQRRLDLKITGTFWPIPLLPAFYSSQAQMEWKNRITILSGNVKINYNVIPWVTKNSIRIKIQGHDIQARLAGDWAKMQGVENIVVEELSADMDVAAQGLGEIYLVRAESPSFHFHIQKTSS